MPNARTTPTALAECPAAVSSAVAVVESEYAMQRRQGNAIGFDPLPEPFYAGASVRLVTANGKVVLRNAPWAKDCSDPYRLSNSDSIVYREWHDRAIGAVLDKRGRADNWCHVTVCAMKDHGDSLAAQNSRPAVPDALAVFVSTDSVPPFSTVLFAEGPLGLGHLMDTMKTLLR